MVADVTAEAGKIKVNRIVAAVDLGVAVNPDVIRAQVEGAVGFALSSVLRNRITLTDGRVNETNFDAYEPTRMREMPTVEVHIVPSQAAPTGIGEPGVAGMLMRHRQQLDGDLAGAPVVALRAEHLEGHGGRLRAGIADRGRPG